MKSRDEIRNDNATAAPEADESDDIRFTILPAESIEGSDPDVVFVPLLGRVEA